VGSCFDVLCDCSRRPEDLLRLRLGQIAAISLLELRLQGFGRGGRDADEPRGEPVVFDLLCALFLPNRQ